MRVPLLLLLAASLAEAASAAPLTRDLGTGLAYARVHALPGDLPDGPSIAGRAFVLDVRYVQGGAAAADALASWLAARSGARTPVLLLANSSTDRSLLAGLRGARALPYLVILGAAAPGFQPDVAVTVAPAAERRAYDALERGAPIESLVTESANKPRNDEAMLEREHLPDSALGDEGGAGQGDLASRPASPPPLVDTVLERAIQLHRALVSLKRL
jgi:hypothetical protein